MRGVARGLGSLARNAGLLGVIGSACFAASGAGAARAPDLFELTIRGTAVADFDHTTAPVERLECETSSRAQGHRTVVFRSSRPTLVRFVGGRIRPVAVRGLEGTVKLRGTNTETSVCAGLETQTPRSCAKTTRRFTSARTSLSGTTAGSITIASPRVALRRIECPREPDEVVALPLGPAPGPLHLSLATLTNPRTTKVTLSASAQRTKNYGAPEKGFVHQRTAWSVTLVRTGR